MLNGYKTYIGLLITLLGFLGVSQFITDAELSTASDAVIQLIGIGIAVYGRVVTKPVVGEVTEI